MPGPAPNPNARRRNVRPGLVVLPGEGFKGSIPRWPLPPDPTLAARIEMLEEEISELEDKETFEGLSKTEATKLTRRREALRVRQAESKAIADTEKKIWRELWRTPQATQWIKIGYLREVAMYTRWSARGQVGDLDAAKEARQQADRLGLTPKGMRALMWTIAVDEVEEKRQERTQAATGTDGASSRRAKFFAVDGGEG